VACADVCDAAVAVLNEIAGGPVCGIEFVGHNRGEGRGRALGVKQYSRQFAETRWGSEIAVIHCCKTIPST